MFAATGITLETWLEAYALSESPRNGSVCRLCYVLVADVDPLTVELPADTGIFRLVHRYSQQVEDDHGQVHTLSSPTFGHSGWYYVDAEELSIDQLEGLKDGGLMGGGYLFTEAALAERGIRGAAVLPGRICRLLTEDDHVVSSQTLIRTLPPVMELLRRDLARTQL